MSADTRPDVWMPLVVGDYLKDTGRLTTELHGAYLLLIMDYWTNGPPPNDDAELAAITKMDARKWKASRPKLERYFRIQDGVWRHKRIDEELERWTEKKRKFTERAAAGGRAKAAKSTASSTASSTSKALLKSCSASASTEVGAPSGAPTLSGQNDFLGPKEVRDAFIAKFGEDWCRSYLDPCIWQDVPERSLTPATRSAGIKICREARSILAQFNLTVLEKAA